MTRPRWGMGSELLPVGMVLVCLAGTLAAVIELHRRAVPPRKGESPPVVVVAPPEPPAVVQPAPLPATPRPAPPDPTKPVLARLELDEADQLIAAQAADRRAEALEAATRAAEAESQSARRREALLKRQFALLGEQVRLREREADLLALDRDVLANQRDAAKAALAKARTRSSYAVLPNQARNGTWRRPIILECTNGTVKLQPRGPSFSLLELSGIGGPRSSPVVMAVTHALIALEGSATPDGAPAVPYIFFVIRPDGIRSYYEARSQLETLGIAFGYELVDQDWVIEYPEPGEPGEPDGLAPPRSVAPLARNGSPPGSGGRGPSGPTGGSNDFVWPARPPGGTGGGGDRDDPLAGPGGGAGPALFPFQEPGYGAGASDSGPGSGPSEGKDRPDDVYVWPKSGPGGGTGTGSVGPIGGDRGPRKGGPAQGPGAPGGVRRPSVALRTAEEGGQAASGGPSTASGSTSGVGKPPAGLVPVGPDGLPQLEAADPANAGTNPIRSSAPAGTKGPATGGGPPTGLTLPGGLNGSASGSTDRRVPILPGAGSGGPGDGPEHKSNSSSLAQPKTRIEVPFEIVVACGPRGVVIHPGGYRLSSKTLKSKHDMLAQELRAVVTLREQVDPLIQPLPRIQFLIEPGGKDTYQTARGQTAFAGLAWPISLQVADAPVLSFSSQEPPR